MIKTYCLVKIIDSRMINEDILLHDDDLDAIIFIHYGIPRQIYTRSNYFDQYDEASFRVRFRLSRESTLFLLNLIENQLEYPYDRLVLKILLN